MPENFIYSKIKSYEEEFKHFVSIREFPCYEVLTKEVSLLLATSQGFDAAASTSYQPQTGQHKLTVSTNIQLTQYLIFHEFTHIWDSEVFSQNDKVRYAGLSGYSEYHASQVELSLLLGSESLKEIKPFSMNTVISTFAGNKTVQQYINEKQQHAIDLFSRYDFPADINVLKSAFGVLFNYWGLRSICKMYASDYTETINNQSFLKFIPTNIFVLLNKIMNDWMTTDAIDTSIILYNGVIFPIIQQYKLA